MGEGGGGGKVGEEGMGFKMTCGVMRRMVGGWCVK